MNQATLAAAGPGVYLPRELNPYTDVYCLLDAIDAIDAFYESAVAGHNQ